MANHLLLVLALAVAATTSFLFERARAPMRLEQPERATPHAIRISARFGLPAVVLGLLYLMSEVKWLGDLMWPLYWIGLVLIFVACLGTAVILAPLALYAAVNGHARDGVIRFVLGMCIVASSALLVATWVTLHLDGKLRRYCERLEPVAVAIEAFERDRGSPPDSLQQLVPAYLTAIPAASGRFSPLVFESIPAVDTLQTMVRYALRTPRRGERDYEAPVAWGKSDATGMLVRFEIQNDDGHSSAEPFVGQVWRDSIAARSRMAMSLAAVFPVGTSLDTLTTALGPPDDRWSVRTPRWQLWTTLDSGVDSETLVRTSKDVPPTQPWYAESPSRIGRWWRVDRGD